MWEALADIAED
jgi:predicted DNA-binding ribbon-helix-helix protein